ncbi:hypothetical protein D3C80_1833440 [compost metagenome]
MAHSGHGAVVHCPHAGRREHAVLLHLQHFLLMPGMHRGIAEVEFVQQLAFIHQHEAHRFPGLDLDRLGGERHVTHDHLDAAARLGGRCRLTKIPGLRR